MSTEAKFVHGEPLMVDYTPGSAVVAGEVLVINGAVRIAHRPSTLKADGSTYNQMALAIAYGVYDGIKSGVAAVAFSDGDPVFWNASSNLFTATSTDTYAGVAIGDWGATETKVRFAHALPGSLYSGNLSASGTLAVAGNATFGGANGITINGTTSGAVRFTTAATSVYTLTVNAAARTVGTATLTIPDTANVADTFAMVTLAQTLANKTLAAPVISTGLTASGSASNDFSASTGTFKTSQGANTLVGAVSVGAAGTTATPSLTCIAGCTNTGYVEIDGKTSGGLKIIPTDATAYLITVTTAAQTGGTTTLTIPNFNNVADTFAFVTLAQTLANKTLTAPVINGATSASGNFDISGSTGTFKSCQGANQLTGATTIGLAGTTATPSLTLASGCTNTGFVEIDGKTSGGIKVIPTDATAYLITVTTAAQTTGTTTLTIPNFNNVADTFAFITLAQTLANKTLTAPVINGATSASGNFDLSGSSGTMLTTTGRFTIGGYTTFKNTTTPVANTGSTVSDAAQLPASNICHITSDSANKGVKLQTGVAGDMVIIINDTAGTASKLYAASGGTINGGSADAAYVIPAAKGTWCFCTAADTWICFDMAAKSTGA